MNRQADYCLFWDMPTEWMEVELLPMKGMFYNEVL